MGKIEFITPPYFEEYDSDDLWTRREKLHYLLNEWCDYHGPLLSILKEEESKAEKLDNALDELYRQSEKTS